MKRDAEIEYLRLKNELEQERTKKEADIEIKKFVEMVDAIGADTIKAIAIAGPEMQAQLLQGLNINATLITDGRSPINLFNTAQGLVNQ